MNPAEVENKNKQTVASLIRHNPFITTKEVCDYMQNRGLSRLDTLKVLRMLEFIGIIEENSHQQYKYIGDD